MRLWIFVLLIGLAVGSSSSFSETDTSGCWWSGCRVSSQRKNPDSRTLTLTDPSYSHVGLPLSESRRRPEQDDAKDFIILECDPQKNLQEGDILLQVNPITKDPSHVYDYLMQSPHAAVVAKKPDGSLYALGTPRNYWPEGSLTHASYHVIRLREYPKEITSPQILAEWRSSPVKYRKIQDWQEQRQVILAKVRKGIEFFEQNVPYYDSARNTQILDPKYKKLFSEWILEGKTCENVPSQYCSELVATIYSVAGADLPKVKSAQFYLDRLEKEVLPKFQNPGESKEQVFKKAIDAFFEDTELWGNLGIDTEEKDRVLEERKKPGKESLLPKKVAKFKANLEWVWGFPPFIRNQLVGWSGLTGSSYGVITPLDFLDSVKDSGSDYAYTGTYLKSACEDPTKNSISRHLIQ
ncbi:MAG: hypothetical protein ACKN9V_04970 [Pseudomonadota bacterium]